MSGCAPGQLLTGELLDAEQLRRMLLAVCAEMIAAEESLCAADRAIGDGDHGIGMRRGFKAAHEMLEKLDTDGAGGPAGVLAALGTSLIGEMGGASGVMFGLMFSAPRTSSTHATPFLPPAAPGQDDGRAMSVEEFAVYMRAGLETVMARGGARAGDKTMVDALLPAVHSLEVSAHEGRDWSRTLNEASAAAAEGAEATRALTARFGKARTLGERAVGHRDPGAISVSLIFAAMAEWASPTKTAGTQAGQAGSQQPQDAHTFNSGDSR